MRFDIQIRHLAALAGILIGSALPIDSIASDRPFRPWLASAEPTKIDWLILELQAHEGDVEFGENGLTVNYYGGIRSAEEGVVYCDIDYLPSVTAELVQMVENGIRKRFELRRSLLPWARLELKIKVARIPN